MAVLQTFSFLAILLFSYIFFNLFRLALDDIPGPVLAKFSNLWRLRETWKGHYERIIQDLHRRHGSIVRIGPNTVSLTDPDVIERIYGIKADLPKVSTTDSYSTRSLLLTLSMR